MGQHCADDGDALFASRRRFGAWERSADLGSCTGRRSGLYAVLFAGVCDRKHQRDALGADGGNSAVRSGCGGLETVSCLEKPYLACPLGADCAVKSRLRPFKEFGSASRRGSFPAGSKLPAVSGLVFCRAISVAF